MQAAHSQPLTWPQLAGVATILAAAAAIAFGSRLDIGKRTLAAIRSKT